MKCRARSMPRRLVWLGLSLVLTAAQAGEIWKCQQGSQVRYSDQPCPAQGDTLPARALQPNVVAAERSAADAASPGTRLAGNVCPEEVEIAAMESRATASSLGPAEQRFFKGEIARARQCRQGRVRYSASDWALSRQAQADQFRPGVEAEARQRAEAMHKAAAARAAQASPEPLAAGASSPAVSSR